MSDSRASIFIVTLDICCYYHHRCYIRRDVQTERITCYNRAYKVIVHCKHLKKKSDVFFARDTKVC